MPTTSHGRRPFEGRNALDLMVLRQGFLWTKSRQGFLYTLGVNRVFRWPTGTAISNRINSDGGSPSRAVVQVAVDVGCHGGTARDAEPARLTAESVRPESQAGGRSRGETPSISSKRPRLTLVWPDMALRAPCRLCVRAHR